MDNYINEETVYNDATANQMLHPALSPTFLIAIGLTNESSGCDIMPSGQKNFEIQH